MKDIATKEAQKNWCPHTRCPVEIVPGVWVVANCLPDDVKPDWALCKVQKCNFWETGPYDRKHETSMGHCTLGS